MRRSEVQRESKLGARIDRTLAVGGRLLGREVGCSSIVVVVGWRKGSRENGKHEREMENGDGRPGKKIKMSTRKRRRERKHKTPKAKGPNHLLNPQRFDTNSIQTASTLRLLTSVLKSVL